MSENARRTPRAPDLKLPLHAPTAFAATLLLWVAASAGAGEAGEAPPCPDAEQPIHWRADHAEGDATGRTILTGNVRMEQGTLRVEADRMVVKRKGESSLKVVACTLLAYEREFELGETLEEAERAVRLNHPSCAQFCVLGGASCSRK